jgi:hypothetical protein
LFAIGAATTIPAVATMVGAIKRGRRPTVQRDQQLVGATRFPRKGDDLF